MADDDKKVEKEPSPKEEQPQPNPPPKQPFVYTRRKSGVLVGMNVTPAAPFGHGPNGAVLAPFGYLKNGKTPRKRKPPKWKSTANAKSAYMRKKEEQTKSLVANILGEKVLNNISLQKKKDNSIETVSKLDTIEEDDADMPRHKKTPSNPGYGNPGMNTGYLVGVAVVAAGAFYLLRNPNMLKKPPTSQVGTPVHTDLFVDNLNVEKKSTNNISNNRKDNVATKSEFSYDY